MFLFLLLLSTLCLQPTSSVNTTFDLSGKILCRYGKDYMPFIETIEIWEWDGYIERIGHDHLKATIEYGGSGHNQYYYKIQTQDDGDGPFSELLKEDYELYIRVQNNCTATRKMVWYDHYVQSKDQELTVADAHYIIHEDFDVTERPKSPMTKIFGPGGLDWTRSKG